MSLREHSRTNLLYRYILRAHIGPFFFSISTLMFLFLLQFVMKFIDQLVGKGLSAWVIMELVALNLSWMLVLAIPMSVLVAVLMAFGDLSGRNEVTVMRASGVSIYRMMAPVVVAAALVALVLVWFNNYVLPESNHALKTLTVDIRRKKPTLTLVNGVFSQDIQGYSILVRRTFENSNELEGVTLYDYSDPARNVVVTAERGAISFSPDYRKLILDLTDGEIHQLDLAQITAYRKIRFSSHRMPPPTPLADGRNMQLRFARLAVAADRFESRMEVSLDGGESWKPGNHQLFVRAAENRSGSLGGLRYRKRPEQYIPLT